jgi:hypothetical protein
MHSSRVATRLGASAALASFAGAQGVDVKVNADGPGDVQNEVRISVFLANPTSIVAAYNDRPGTALPNPLGVSYTTNSGASWNDVQLSVPANPFGAGNLDVIFDPAVSFGPPNNYFVAYIATTSAAAGASGLFIERSENGGISWSGPTTIAADPAAVGPVDPNYRFNDRCHTATHPTGTVSVTWIKDVGVNLPTSDVYYSFSMHPPGPGPGPFPPTGLNFTVPVTVNDNPGGTDMGNAPSVVMHPGGRVYVAWIDVNVQNPVTGTIKIDWTSAPTGAPVFGVDQIVRTIQPLPQQLTDSNGMTDARAGSYPVVAVDHIDVSGLSV